MKEYNNGKITWRHGEPTGYYNGVPSHILLGPCPDCGSPTFNCGGGWRCNGYYCNRSASNPAPSVGNAPDWWDTDMNVMKDGNAWCAFRDGFINLQESNAAYGETPKEAVKNLREFEINIEQHDLTNVCYVTDMNYLLEQNKALVEALKAIKDYTFIRQDLSLYIKNVYDACDDALTSYKGDTL